MRIMFSLRDQVIIIKTQICNKEINTYEMQIYTNYTGDFTPKTIKANNALDERAVDNCSE